MGWGHDGAVTSSIANTATATRVGGLCGEELESATAYCVVAVPGPTAAVPGLGSEVPEPGATTAVPGPLVEVPEPPADRVRFWRRLDRRFEEAPERDTSWYSLSGGADPCQGICLLVVGPWHVEELASFKVSADLLDEESIARHVCVLGVPVAG